MELHQDFKTLAALLMSHRVKFMIVGGYAVSAYGRPRYTGDLDFFIEKSPENASRVVAALHEFFGPMPEIKEENFLDENRMSQFGVEPVRIDFLVSISGIGFAEAYARHELLDHSGMQLPFISLVDLRTNKLASGRHKDLSDLSDHLPNPSDPNA